jgi:3'-phosphoadenosine 5'-phosphosulfate sulfotransferase (PAPS reductase)/FAD synthetase
MYLERIECELLTAMQLRQFPYSSSPKLNDIPDLNTTTQHQFFEKLDASVGIITQALEEHGEEGLSFSFNGGKDCTILLHLYAAVVTSFRKRKGHSLKKPIETLYVTTQNSFSDIEQFVSEAESRLALRFCECSFD